MNEIVEAEFLEESKGRFIGKVMIGGKTEECYISSSSKLSKYVRLKNKQVLLEKTIGKNLRTDYKLFALKKKEKFILLNLNESNQMLERYLVKKGIDSSRICREYTCSNGLKTDLKIDDNYYIEVKTLISENDTVLFPGEYSKRFERQLKLYIDLLKQKKQVELAIMLFNEKIKKIELNSNYIEICKELDLAVSLGMRIKVYKAKYWNGEVSVFEDNKVKLTKETKTEREKGRIHMEAECFAENMLNYENSLEADYKKNKGIFYTDPFLADKMIRFLPVKKNDLILDPCCGTGSFIRAALANGYKNVYGIDQDKGAIAVCKKLTGSRNLWAMDTLGMSGDKICKQIQLNEKPDYVIGNPPYAPLGEGVNLNTDAAFLNKVNNSGCNLFIAALYRAIELVKDGGMISYIIPKNFLHVSGYSNLRKYVLKNKTIVSIVDLGMHFKKVRGEQIVLTIKNEKPTENSKIKLLQLLDGDFKKNTLISQKYYEDEILLFRSYRDYRIYHKLTTKYDTFNDVCEGYIGRGKSKSPEAIIGKEIRKFGYKNHNTPSSGNQIFIQNIYSTEAGVIAAFGGNYEASQTVTVFTDGEEENCRYMLGILHSKLCNFFLFKYCYNNSKLTMHTDAKYLKKIPLIKFGTQQETYDVVDAVKKIERLEYMSDAWFDAMEELDEVVYKLFHLTALEATFIKEEMQKIQSKRWIKNAE